MDNKIYRTKLAVVSIGQRAKAWQRKLEDELTRTDNISDSPVRADALVVIIDKSFPWLILCAIRHHNDCFEAIRDALAAGKVLLPVCVENAVMPQADSLPKSIRALAQFQAIALDRESRIPGLAARLVVDTKTILRPYVPAENSDRRFFLSYRRDDSWYWASLLARVLTQRLGAYNVFLDIGSIKAGRSFEKEILNSIKHATDFVILVGKAFLAPDHTGRRRLDDPKDYMRREIMAAIEYKKKIHIVLVGDAPLPDQKQIPHSIAPAFKEAMTLQLKDWREADSIADSIFERPEILQGIRSEKQRTLLFNIKQKPILSPRFAASFLTPEQKANRFVTAAVPPLAELGWQPIDLKKSKRRIIMTRPDDETYRFIFDFSNSELILAEKARGFSTLGLKGWKKRATFPITPDAPDIDLLRPSDRLLEAMENPGAFLDRVGRVDLDIMISKPPMSRAKVDYFLRRGCQPSRRALDQYAQELLSIRARGGLRPLDRIHQIFLGENIVAVAVAVNPATGKCMASSNNGIYEIDILRGNTKLFAPRPIGPQKYIKHLSFSKNGMLAVTDDLKQLSVFKNNGAAIVKRRSPYSSLKRYTSSMIKFREPSWSSDEKHIAIGARDRIWIFNLNEKKFEQFFLKVKEDLYSLHAMFIPNSGDLLIRHDWNIWRVSRRSGRILQQFEFRAGSDFFDPKPNPLSVGFDHTGGFDPSCMALSADGKFLAIGGNDGQIVLANPNTLLPNNMRVWHKPLADNQMNCKIETLAFSLDGRKLASVANDNRLVVGDARNGNPIADALLSRDTDSHGFPIKHDVCWSLNGDKVIVVNNDGHIDIWNIK